VKAIYKYQSEHGVVVLPSEAIVLRQDHVDDGTFWEAKYQESTDGEYNGLRDGDARITQLFPKQITITVYEA